MTSFHGCIEFHFLIRNFALHSRFIRADLNERSSKMAIASLFIADISQFSLMFLQSH